MTTEAQGAQRCDRCERVTETVCQVTLATDTLREESVTVRRMLCRRCRSEITDALNGRERVTW